MGCHDCAVAKGQVHQYGCDAERCPFCGGQLISCDCIYEKLGLNPEFGTRLYEEGPTQEQEKVWLKMLNHTGRIPY